MKSEPRMNISNAPTMNEVSTASDSNIKLKPKEPNVTPQHQTQQQQQQTSNTSTPNRTIGFKFNKSKKEVNSASNSNNNSNPTSQFPSVTSTPRKKLEKLNYKSGIDILELYKAKHSCKMLNNDVSQIILENNRIYESYERQQQRQPSTSSTNPMVSEDTIVNKRSSIQSKKNSINNSDDEANVKIVGTSAFYENPTEGRFIEKRSSRKEKKIVSLDSEDVEDDFLIETGKKSLKEKLIKSVSKSQIILEANEADISGKHKKSIKKKKIVFV